MGENPFTGEFQPDATTFGLEGDSTQGDWALFVTDDEVGNGDGMVTDFKLYLCICH
ncbi:MAG: hypothetical protein HYY06_30510 [Deltaproteobacteria bacterium]|nr:hypothetical protein [Deltaproteobacteria bacterium]